MVTVEFISPSGLVEPWLRGSARAPFSQSFTILLNVCFTTLCSNVGGEGALRTMLYKNMTAFTDSRKEWLCSTCHVSVMGTSYRTAIGLTYCMNPIPL